MATDRPGLHVGVCESSGGRHSGGGHAGGGPANLAGEEQHGRQGVASDLDGVEVGSSGGTAPRRSQSGRSGGFAAEEQHDEAPQVDSPCGAGWGAGTGRKEGIVARNSTGHSVSGAHSDEVRGGAWRNMEGVGPGTESLVHPWRQDEDGSGTSDSPERSGTRRHPTCATSWQWPGACLPWQDGWTSDWTYHHGQALPRP